MSQYLHGLHEPGGEQHMGDKPGWLLHLAALSENANGADYRPWARFTNILRLNWGYGSTGTLPTPDQYGEYARRCASYAANSPGVDWFSIANEPNHENERPNGQIITSANYVAAFLEARDAIKRVRPDAKVVPAAMAPYHANPTNWLTYLADVLERISVNGGCDAINIHAYTRTANPDDITSMAKMGAPLQDQFRGFFTYLDALSAVPHRLRSRPALITEFDEVPGWVDANTGVVQEAYAEINRWNARPDTQKVHALILYRWPLYDQWHIDGKQGVIDDFRMAVAFGYRAPVVGSAPTPTPPITQTTQPTIPSPGPGLDWDNRLKAQIVRAQVQPGQRVRRVIKGRWYNREEAGGRMHIYWDVLDEHGNRQVGLPMDISWPGKTITVATEEKRGEGYGGNFGVTPGKYDIQPADGIPSDRITGIETGQDGNTGIHTAHGFVFQIVTEPVTTQPPQPPTQPPATVPLFTHPIADPALRIVSQPFGASPERYAQFGLDGHNGLDFAVPLGTPIRAVDDGMVVEVLDDTDGYGRYVKLEHVWGHSLYAHLQMQIAAHVMMVKAGDLIGYSGNTGNSTGPHLHFGMRVHPFTRGRPFDGYSDPQPYLNRSAEPGQPQARIVQLIHQAASEFDVDAELFTALVWAESSFNPNALSDAGAMGLCQIMPATWAEWGPKVGAVDPYSAVGNLRVGAAYLAWLISTLNGDVWKALLAYVWGIGNVLAGRTPPPETLAYVASVLKDRALLEAVEA